MQIASLQSEKVDRPIDVISLATGHQAERLEVVFSPDEKS